MQVLKEIQSDILVCWRWCMWHLIHTCGLPLKVIGLQIKKGWQQLYWKVHRLGDIFLFTNSVCFWTWEEGGGVRAPSQLVLVHLHVNRSAISCRSATTVRPFISTPCVCGLWRRRTATEWTTSAPNRPTNPNRTRGSTESMKWKLKMLFHRVKETWKQQKEFKFLVFTHRNDFVFSTVSFSFLDGVGWQERSKSGGVIKSI